MCGIFGYIGPKEATQITLSGLKKLEYRGYDSAGMASILDGKIVCYKDVGKISSLEKLLEGKNLKLQAAISHTRWATHGKPSQENAHPHLDGSQSLVVVHNGIIENYQEIRNALKSKNILFHTDTDTEVIPQLIQSLYKGDLLEAVAQALPLLEGSLAIAVMHKDWPDTIVVASRESPLAIGCGKGEFFVSSDPNAFIEYTRETIYLEKSQIAMVNSHEVVIFDEQLKPVKLQKKLLDVQPQEVSKGGFEHFTLKEIFEQPEALKRILFASFQEDYGTVDFSGLNLNASQLQSVSRILILACGTSWHAGCVGAYLIEELAHIPVQVEISSEFRYKNPIIQDGTLVIAISQSGETADTIAAMRELKAKGAKILGICNVEGSTIAREADFALYLKAGPEIGVCSTKAFTSQLAVLALFTLFLGRLHHMNKQEGIAFIQELKQLPVLVQQVLSQSSEIEKLAKKYAKYDHFFYLGRSYLYPTCLEAALKIKEIAYVNAQGYPAGEIKHGPIALIDANCPTIALCTNRLTYKKMCNNLMEIKARGGPVLAFIEEGLEDLENIADDVFYLPGIIDELAPIPVSVALQLFAYYVAKEKGASIDHPRNLAKSVTVE